MKTLLSNNPTILPLSACRPKNDIEAESENARENGEFTNRIETNFYFITFFKIYLFSYSFIFILIIF